MQYNTTVWDQGLGSVYLGNGNAPKIVGSWVGSWVGRMGGWRCIHSLLIGIPSLNVGTVVAVVEEQLFG